MDKVAGGGTLEGWLGGPVRIDNVVRHDNDCSDDPTLSHCMQREIESNRYRNAINRTLQRHDVVAMKERRRRNLVTTPDNVIGCRCSLDPNSDGGEYQALVELRETTRVQDSLREANDDEHDDKKYYLDSSDTLDHGNNGNNDSSDSDDEFDYLLDVDFGGDDNNSNSLLKQAEDRRRQELEMAALTQQILKQHGYGTHRQIHPSRILHVAGLSVKKQQQFVDVAASAVVVHLVDPESIASASLDLFLEELAGMEGCTKQTPYTGMARGTKFMRSLGRSALLMNAELASKVLPKLQPDRDIPALVAIRDGVVINSCPRLSGLTTDPVHHKVDMDAVYQWLDRAGVLLSEPPQFYQVCQIRPEEEALMDYLSTPATTTKYVEEEENRFDCGNPTCTKSFPHEHIGVPNEQQSGLLVSEDTVLGDEQVSFA